MKLRKLLSLALAALMLLSLTPAVFAVGAPSKAAEPADKSSAESVNTSYINTRGCLLSYTELNSAYPCSTGIQGSRKYVEITNGGHANTTAGFVSQQIVMKAGEKMKFSYWYSTELNYDFFRFSYVFEEEIHQEEYISGNTGGDEDWFVHTFTAPQDGWYSFMFEYIKDSSGDVGADCVRISDLYVLLHWDQQRVKAVTGTGSGMFDYDFNYSSTLYPFDYTYSTLEGHYEYLSSTNGGQSNVTSGLKAEGRTRACTLSFDYAVSCEAQGSGGSYYDYFEVTVDGTSVLKIAGDHWSWTHFTHALSAGWHEIVFRYVKDSSVDGGNDRVAIDNISISYPSGDSIPRWEEINALSPEEGVYFNTPSGERSCGVKTDSDGSAPHSCPNNRYMDSSAANFSTVINMEEGEMLSFDYVTSCEPNYDQLVFSVNEGVLLEASGWADRYWHTFWFTAPETGTYYFDWIYLKDDDVSEGWDYALVKNVTYYGSYNDTLGLSAVLDSASDPIEVTSSFTAGPGFSPIIDEVGCCAVSRSTFCDGWSAVMTASPGGYTPAGSLIAFTTKVSTEEDYDKLWFYIKENGTIVESYCIGSGSLPWDLSYIPIDEGGYYTFEWVYEKDVNSFDGEDCVWIAGIYYERGSSGVLMGDVNNDGSVNVTDALLVLRYSMNLISSLAAPSAADVNGDGNINLTDALLILRASMGLVSL